MCLPDNICPPEKRNRVLVHESELPLPPDQQRSAPAAHAGLYPNQGSEKGAFISLPRSSSEICSQEGPKDI